MKLNSAQIRAIANKILAEITTANTEFIDKTTEEIKKSHGKKLVDYRKKALQYQKLVKSMNAEMKVLYGKNRDFFRVCEIYCHDEDYNGGCCFEGVIQSAEKDYINDIIGHKKKPLPYTDMIINDVVLETVSCPDIETLLLKIKAKYI